MGLTKGPAPEGKGTGQGLAALLEQDPATAWRIGEDKPSSSNSNSEQQGAARLCEAATHTLGLEHLQHVSGAGGRDAAVVGILHALQERVDALQDAAAASGSIEAGAAPSEPSLGPSTSSLSTAGRLGPARVAIDKASARGQLQYSNGDLAAESLNNFSSLRANVCVYAGKWQYEALIQTAWQPGIQQIGWATLQCPFTAEEGVGDAPDSYAYDGKRVRKWNVKSQAYGEAWAAGDVIGSCLDLERGEITFYRNGVNMGVAFRNVRTMQPALAYFPTVSLSYTERVELNFGARPFLHPVPGYQPLQAPPPEPQLALGGYLLGCMERLARTAAAAGGVGAWGVEEGPWGEEAERLAGAGSEVVPAKGQEGGSGSRGGAAGRAVAAALAAEGAGAVPVLEWDDAALLAGAVCSHLAPLLLLLQDSASGPSAAAAAPGSSVCEYFVYGPLLQSLVRLHGAAAPHDGAAARAFVRLLQVSLHPDAFAALMSALLEALARRCVSAPMQPQDFPYSASYPFISLACCLVQGVPAVRRVFLEHRTLYQMLESYMARKPPSAEDLKGLLPVVWWPGCKEEPTAETRMRAGLAAFAAAKARMEECQYRLLGLLVGQPAASNEGDDALVAFVRYLVQRNRGATRDVQPHGLSDPNVLLSVWFVLLRLLHGALDSAPSFPAGDIFVRASQRGSIDPTNDLPRLGGLLSFLLRESPAPPSELGPVDVKLPAPLNTPEQDPACRLLASSPASVTELLHLSCMLYTYRGAGIIRQIHTLSQSLANNQSGLEQVERQLEARLLSPLPIPPGSGGGSASSSGGGAAAAAGGGSPAAVGATAAGAPPAAVAAPAPAPPVAVPTAGSVSAPYLHEARSMLRAEVQTAVRCIRLLESTLFGGWKMEALLRQAAWMAQALMGVTRRPGALLAFVPTCYVDLLLDVLAAYRSCEAPFAPPAQLRAHGLDDLLQLCTAILNDSRIRNPDTKEQLLAAAAGLLDSRGLAAVVEDNPLVAKQIVNSCVAMFDSKLWHPVSSVLAHVVRGCGLGAASLTPLEPSALPTSASASVAGPSSSPSTPSPPSSSASPPAAPSTSQQRGAPPLPLPRCQALLRHALRPTAPEFKGFCDRLFNTVNWAVTEGTSTVASLHEARRPAGTIAGAAGGGGVARRPQVDEQQQVRKVVLMLDLTKTLLRLLEFLATHLPAAFLAPACALNLTRLLELVPFVLGHFTHGPDARRLNELLEASQQQQGLGLPQTLMRLGMDRQYTVIHVEKPLYEKVNKPELLIPLVGTLVVLWRADKEAAARLASGSRPPSGSGSGALDVDADLDLDLPRKSFVEALADVADERMQGQLSFLRGLDWEASLPSAASCSAALRQGLADFGALCDEVAEARRAMTSGSLATGGAAAASPGGAAGGAAGAAGASPPDEVPEEFLDPITTALMTDPVVLPDSGVTLDRSTIERQLSIQGTDPFSRKELTMDMVKPNAELKARIRAYLAARKGAGAGAKP